MRVLIIFSVTLLASCITIADSKGSQPFFIPEELQTILSLAYSRLPPIKLGSDQRFGVGFRIGRNADAQILVELGPQSETRPIGGGNDSNVSKRESSRQKYKTYNKNANKKRDQNTVSPIKLKVDKTPEEIHSKEEVTKIIKSAEESKYVTTSLNSTQIDNTETKVTYKKKDTRRNGKTADSNKNVQENAVDSNTSTTPEPFINVFMKWLTRLTQTNVNSSRR